MSEAQPNTEIRGPVEHLDDSDFEGIKTWLRRALRNEEPLPKATPDEPPDVAIHRADQTLRRSTREDIREACIALARDFAHTLSGDREYLAALLGLAWWFRLEEAADELYPLIVDGERFPALDFHQQQLVLGTLNDFEKELPVEFWRELVKLDARAFGGPAFSGLLLYDMKQALQVLPEFPDDESLADIIGCLLANYEEGLDAPLRARLRQEVTEVRPCCTPSLARVLDEWLEQFDVGDVPEGGGLASELKDELEDLEKTYPESPQPSRHDSARLPTAA